MAKECRLLVKPGKNCIDRDREYKLTVGHFSSTVSDSTKLEATNVSKKDTQAYGDISGCIVRTDNGAENNQNIYFSIANPQIGWPWAIMSTDQHLERYVTHKLNKGESFTFTSIDGVKFTLERVEDTKNKEFVIWLDV
jgi:hypothetical protein